MNEYDINGWSCLCVFVSIGVEPTASHVMKLSKVYHTLYGVYTHIIYSVYSRSIAQSTTYRVRSSSPYYTE